MKDRIQVQDPSAVQILGVSSDFLLRVREAEMLRKYGKEGTMENIL